jgi:hypothetical protein
MWCSCILLLVSAAHLLSRCHLWHCSLVRMVFPSVRRVPAAEKRYLVMIIRPLEHLRPAFIYLSYLNTILFFLSPPSSRRTGCEERWYTRIITIESKREPPQYLLGHYFVILRTQAHLQRMAAVWCYNVMISDRAPWNPLKCLSVISFRKLPLAVLQNAAPMFQQTFHFLENITRHTARLCEEDHLNSISIESRCGDSAPRIDNLFASRIVKYGKGRKVPGSRMVPCS